MNIKIENFLKKIRILDYNGDVSLTNIFMIIAVVRFAIAPSTALAELALPLASIVLYGIKQHTTSYKVDDSVLNDEVSKLKEMIEQVDNDTLKDEVSKLKDKVNAMMITRGITGGK